MDWLPKPNPMPTLEALEPRSLKRLAHTFDALVRGRLWLQILIALVLGIATGVSLSPATGWVSPKVAETLGEWLALPGYFFLAMVQMIVVPLVFSSIVRGIAANENVEQLRRTGLRLVVYFLVITALSVVLGIGIAYWLRPGEYIDSTRLVTDALPALAQDVPAAQFILRDLPGQMVNLLPSNPLQSMASTDMLKVVLFAVVFGLALVSLPRQTAEPLLDFMGSLEGVCMVIVRWVMVLAPAAVFGLIAQLTLRTGLGVLMGLSMFIVACMAGFVALVVLYIVLLRVLAHYPVGRFFARTRENLLMAFSVNSSAAVMPMSIQTAEEGLGVRTSTAQFVIPIGATVNMSATALYQGLSAVFLAQVFGIDLPLASITALVITVVGASIGTPAMPGVAVIVLASVLGTVGIPTAGLTLILGVDRVLGMFRSALNVAGDHVAALVMERLDGQYAAAKSVEIRRNGEAEPASNAHAAA